MLDSDFLILEISALRDLPRSDSAVTTVLPEAACTEKATSESDVCSPGMVVIEVVTGQRF